jgi:hypothetical protein
MDLAAKHVASDGAANDRPGNVVEKARQHENDARSVRPPFQPRFARRLARSLATELLRRGEMTR